MSGSRKVENFSTFRDLSYSKIGGITNCFLINARLLGNFFGSRCTPMKSGQFVHFFIFRRSPYSLKIEPKVTARQ